MNDPNGTRDLITRVLQQCCFGSEHEFPLQPTVERHFAPDYVQRSDGRELDRDEFTKHLRALRGKAAHGRVEVLETVVQDDRVADRHRVHVTKNDGSIAVMEVFMFAHFADDGRIRRVDEAATVVDGTAEDADLASAVK